MTVAWTPSRLGNLAGKRVIVTGATNGVGLATAPIRDGWPRTCRTSRTRGCCPVAHKTVKFLADRIANDIDAGAAPTLYCVSEPIPPGSYVGVTGKFGLRGDPVLAGRSTVACDYGAAAQLVAFAERETGTMLPV